MRQEIFLEVIDHRHRLMEEFLRTATIHQNGLCAKHLRHFGQDTGASLSDQPVAELTNQRIGSNTAEAIAATALQTDAEFAYGDFFTLICFRYLIKVAKHVHTGLYLVAFHFLGYQQFDAVFVVITQHGHKVLRLVVLTAQTQYQHTACIRMQTDVA